MLRIKLCCLETKNSIVYEFYNTELDFDRIKDSLSKIAEREGVALSEFSSSEFVFKFYSYLEMINFSSLVTAVVF